MRTYKIINHYVRVKFDDCIDEGIVLERKAGKDYRIYFPNAPIEWNVWTVARSMIVDIGPSVKVPRF